MPKVYISLGSNQGDQIRNLQEAVKALANNSKIKLTKASAVYKTEPVGFEDQPWFYNAAVEVETSYQPEELLDQLQSIEAALGRIRTLRWGPRTLDLDILLYGDENIETERLIVPHPRMLERDFVLVPLLEIEPGLTVQGKKVAEILAQSSADKKVICTDEKLC